MSSVMPRWRAFGAPSAPSDMENVLAVLVDEACVALGAAGARVDVVHGQDRELLMTSAGAQIGPLDDAVVGALRAQGVTVAEIESACAGRAALPLVAPNGAVVGVLRAVWSHDHPPPEAAGAALRGLARATAAALEPLDSYKVAYQRLAALFEGTIAVAVADLDGVITEVNAAYCRLTGYDRSELEGRSFYALTHPEDREGNRRAVDAMVRGEASSVVYEKRYIRKDGAVIWVRITASEIRDASSTTISSFAVVEDITARKNAERERDRVQNLLRVASRQVRMGAWSVTPSADRVTWSDEVCRIHELPPGACPTVAEAIEFYAPEYRGTISDAFAACARDGVPYDLELQIVTATGRRRWVRTNGEAERNAAGTIVGINGAFQDISDLRQAKEDALNLAERFRSTLDSIADGFFTVDRDWRFTYVNRAALEVMQLGLDDVLGKVIWEVFPEAVDSEFHVQYQRAMRDNVAISFVSYYAPLDVWLQVRGYPSAKGLAVYFLDITQQQTTQRQLKEHAAALDQAREAIIIRTLDHHVCAWNRGAEGLYGWTAEEAIGRSARELFYRDPTEFQDHVEEALRNGSWVGELTHHRKDGERLTVESRWTVVCDDGGWPASVLTINSDVTRRREREAQQRQSQRLEAVGQLTGGVAHDFNNLLTVILGNSEVLSEQLAGQSSLRQLAEMTHEAATRGADLTSRLLSFSRRQSLHPGAVDVGQLVAGMQGLLRRTLGEHIELTTHPADGLWPALVDRTQLETAILNLCINARDAMPDGGRLTIGADNVHLANSASLPNNDMQPGDYIVLSVSDTGVGMRDDVAARAFEPFFTTKEVGKGSGLGLSMVYGFANQSGGHVRIRSRLGQGTTIDIYLPRSVDAVDANAYGDAPAAIPAGRENILLVEDDDLVRAHVSQILTTLGYRVTAVANGAAALAVLKEQDDIDLLFTDLVMPGGMNGHDVAEAARWLRPSLKILFTSGYDSAVAEVGDSDAGIRLLKKPYGPQALGQHIRAVLDVCP